MSTRLHASKLRDVVILHGWGLSAATFDPLTKSLQRAGFRVFTPDLPGFGKTKIPDRPLSLADYSLFLERFVSDNAIRKPIIIGHSFGGRVALRFVSDHPDAVAGLILSGTPGYSSVSPLKYAVSVVIAKAGNLFFSAPFLSAFADGLRKRYYWAMGARDFYRAEGSMRETFKRVVREDLSEYMKSVRIPVLLLWGADDVLVPLRIAEKMHKTMTTSELTVFPGVGHNMLFRQPERVIPEIRQFAEQL